MKKRITSDVLRCRQSSFKIIVVATCLFASSKQTGFAQALDLSHSPEGRVLITVYNAYLQDHPETIKTLQTDNGKKQCDKLFSIPAITNLPIPKPIGNPYETSELEGIFFKKRVYTSKLSFIFRDTGNTPLDGVRFTVMFTRGNTSVPWQLDDILETSTNQKISQMSKPELANLLTWYSQACNVANAAQRIMDLAPSDYQDMRIEIEKFQVTAANNSLDKRPEVHDFISAANAMEAFATQWNQSSDNHITGSESDQHNRLIVVGVQVDPKIQNEANATIDLSQGKASIGATQSATIGKAVAQYHDEHGSTSATVSVANHSIGPLDKEQSEKYQNLENAKQAAFGNIIKMEEH